MPDDRDIVNISRGYLNVKYRHQGRNDAGMDCVGVPIRASNEKGYTHPDFDYRNYGRRPDLKTFLRVFKTFMRPVRVSDAGHGDVLILAFPVFACHCGILAKDKGYETLIHAHMSRRIVMEEPLILVKHMVRGAFQFIDYGGQIPWHS